MEHKDYLIEKIEKLGFTENSQNIELIELFYNELIEWNKKVNLTRIVDEKDFIDKHILDSLSCKKVLDKILTDDLKVIDIGTGAGFPLLPLWFFYQNIQITLVDAVNKKLEFIRHFLKVAKEQFPDLDIGKIQVIHSRAEDLAKDKNHREKYDLIVSRALSKLPSLIELAMPFIKMNGLFLAMKIHEIEEEVGESQKVTKMMGGGEINIDKFELLDIGLMRSFVTIEKIAKMPGYFPRKSGIAQKNPII